MCRARRRASHLLGDPAHERFHFDPLLFEDEAARVERVGEQDVPGDAR
jgi:hypothetical protein